VTTDRLPAQIIRTQRFTLGVPGQFTLAPDGSAVLFLRSRAGDDPVGCLWALDVASGTERLIADPHVLLGGQAPGAAATDGGRGWQAGTPLARLGIAGYATDHAARVAAFTLAGELWIADVGTGQVRQLPSAGPAANACPDPSGKRIAYTHDATLRVIEADGTGDHAIAAPDGPDVTFGVCEEAGAVSLRAGRGYWWAPDGTRLLVARVDSAAVQLWHLADLADLAKPPRTVRYPAAGTANADVSLWVTALDGSRTEVCWDRHAFEYVAAAGWDCLGPYAAVQSRDQQTVLFLAISQADGKATVLAEWHDDCWVQLIPGLPARTASGALLAHADRRGTRHLTVGGAVVTPPGLQLRALLGVDGEEVLFAASADPVQVHLWSYQAGHGLWQLTAEPGVHFGVRRSGTLVHVACRADSPGGHTVVQRAGRPPVPIPSLAERPMLRVHATRLALGPRYLRADLYLPSWHRPGTGKLPILADPYGGASSQRVTADLDWRSLLSQWFAEHGFAVLVADGRGTPGRGPDWERAVYGDLFAPVLEDQVTAVQEAARQYPDLDLGRVGIRGWSFSGSLAALAVLRRPDVFHAAVAGAAVTDQRLFNTHWRERFLGHPDVFPERYEASSLVLEAPKLTRPLLLIHGLADDNVHPANTLRLSSALLAAGRPHEVLLLPGVGHASMGPGSSEQLLWRQVRFLQRHLNARAPTAQS